MAQDGMFSAGPGFDLRSDFGRRNRAGRRILEERQKGTEMEEQSSKVAFRSAKEDVTRKTADRRCKVRMEKCNVRPVWANTSGWLPLIRQSKRRPKESQQSSRTIP